ncbi:hypothetical protein EDD98_6134 [Streptomyces sp. PanSC19]|nr:hypothetical protein EDD98_6134 [Streptomyces sp. PanSC19]
MAAVSPHTNERQADRSPRSTLRSNASRERVARAWTAERATNRLKDFQAVTTALPVGHAKQRALAVRDLVGGHLAGRRIEAAFALAGKALDTGIQSRSGRIVERARAVRRTLTATAPPKVVRDFDERLHGAYVQKGAAA